MHSYRLLTLALAGASLFAQQKYTAGDYQRAEKFMTYNTAPLVYRSGVRPTWLPDERFWYRVTTSEGAEFILVDPAKGTRAPAFDHVKLAAALSAASGRTVDAKNLPFQTIDFTPDGKSVIVQTGGRFVCDTQGTKCTAEAGAAPASGGRGGALGIEARSPDGKKSAFVRDNNLWVRNLETNRETQLTMDGIKDFGY